MNAVTWCLVLAFFAQLRANGEAGPERRFLSIAALVFLGAAFLLDTLG